MEQHLSLFYVLSFLTAVIAFAYAAYLYLWVKKQQVVNKRIAEVAQLIKEGANTFMRREYKVLAIFSAVVAALIFLLLPSPVWKGAVLDNLAMAAAYICGTVLSAIAGKIGIMVAALSNARAAEGAQKGIKPAFLIGFRGGAVMGLIVVGCSLLGAATVGLLVGVIIGLTTDYFTDDTKPIVKKVAHASKSGPAFTILSGISYGFISALPAMWKKYRKQFAYAADIEYDQIMDILKALVG